MSNDIAIRVEGLGKRYRLGQSVDLSRTFRETLVSLPRFFTQKAGNLAHSLSHALNKPDGESSDDMTPPGTFWALKDVSFEVKRGEVVGIIGRNGAGKSTLLKILSRITTPTTGRAEIHGRVGSLLEVGTGFHPELTGRENIYLNGAILGMRKAEIERKFDEIVAFAEIEKFLDTPVKRYSSGMYVRLAFAVAAHLEPEILIVDEVLAVGDAEFQKKCLGKMEDASGEGRTVLFVSHNMQAVRRLCERGVLMKEGRIQASGSADEITEYYLRSISELRPNCSISPEMHRVYPPDLEVYRLDILNRHEEVTDTVLMDEEFCLVLYFKVNCLDQSYRVGIVFKNSEGVRIATIINTADGGDPVRTEAFVPYYISVKLKNVFLPGTYYMDINTKTTTDRWVDTIEGVPINVAPVSVNGTGYAGIGIVRVNAEWSPQRKAI